VLDSFGAPEQVRLVPRDVVLSSGRVGHSGDGVHLSEPQRFVRDDVDLMQCSVDGVSVLVIEPDEKLCSSPRPAKARHDKQELGVGVSDTATISTMAMNKACRPRSRTIMSVTKLRRIGPRQRLIPGQKHRIQPYLEPDVYAMFISYCDVKGTTRARLPTGRSGVSSARKAIMRAFTSGSTG
jgi:hypothetical protein